MTDTVVPTELVNEFTGDDVLCLHAICQPLVDQMQAVIRFQRDQLSRAVAALDYSIRMQGNNLLGTQQFTKSTLIISELTGKDVDSIREHYIQGSANMHRGREV